VGVQISAVLNSYERQDYIWQALESLVSQDTSREFEIVVLSPFPKLPIPNPLQERAEKLKRSIRLVTIPLRPVGSALSIVAEAARGEFLAFLDDDDLWVPSKVRAIEKAASEVPSLSYFHNGQIFVDESNVPIPVRNLHRLIRHQSSLRSQGSTFVIDPMNAESIAASQPYEPDLNNSSIAIRRSVLLDHMDAVRPVRRGEDTFLYYCALLAGKPLYLTTDRLTRYRLHSGASTVRTATKSAADPWASYTHFAAGHLESLGIVQDRLQPTSTVPAEEFIDADVAFWSTMTSIGAARFDGRRGRDHVGILLGGPHRRPKMRDLIAAFIGATGLLSPSLSRAAYGASRRFW